jgi:ACS family D-galactonate transporter-like MFS transporter
MTTAEKMVMGEPRGGERPSKARVFILILLFLGITLNYLDRTNMAVAAPILQKELNISPAMMGVIFSAFGWIYMAMQIPSGVILDRYGTRKTFGWALFLWSGCTFLFGFATSVIHFIILRLTLGTTEAPAFPSATRCVAAWFPKSERATAVGVYISGQYVGLAFLMPLLTWLVSTYGWQSIFWMAGGFGIFYSIFWLLVYREPSESKHINQAELDYLRAGGAVTNPEPVKFQWATLGSIIVKRELWGLYLAKFAMSSTLWFFFTWFPSYLVREKHMTLMQAGWYSMLPFACAMGGILVCGVWSDWMSRHGVSHTMARKTPIVLGMVLTACIIGGNYIDDPLVVVALMSVVFFGQGMANGFDALMADTAPAEAFGTTVGVCQMCANLGGALTPLLVGFIIQATGSYAGGIAYVSACAVLGIVSVAFVIKKVERIVL